MASARTLRVTLPRPSLRGSCTPCRKLLSCRTPCWRPMRPILLHVPATIPAAAPAPTRSAATPTPACPVVPVLRGHVAVLGPAVTSTPLIQLVCTLQSWNDCWAVCWGSCCCVCWGACCCVCWGLVLSHCRRSMLRWCCPQGSSRVHHGSQLVCWELGCCQAACCQLLHAVVSGVVQQHMRAICVRHLPGQSFLGTLKLLWCCNEKPAGWTKQR